MDWLQSHGQIGEVPSSCEVCNTHGEAALQVGRFREQLQGEYPSYDFSLLGHGIWWHAGASADPKHIEWQEMGACCRDARVCMANIAHWFPKTERMIHRVILWHNTGRQLSSFFTTSGSL